MMPQIARLAHLTRLGEWFDSKVPPLHLAFFLFIGPGLFRRGAVFEFLGLTLFACAFLSYGYYLNDFGDRATDRAAGKRKLVASFRESTAVVFALTLAGLSVLGCAAWLTDPLVVAALAVALLGATTYSIGPRFKERGSLGVISSAVSQRVLPALVYAAVLHASTGPVLAYCLWAGLVGVRFILLHQIEDIDADAQSGTTTFSRTRGRVRAQSFLALVVYPAEVLSSIVLLLFLFRELPVAALVGGVWVLFEVIGWWRGGANSLRRPTAMLGELILPVAAAGNAAFLVHSPEIVGVAAAVTLWSSRIAWRGLVARFRPRELEGGRVAKTFLDGIDVTGSFGRSTDAWIRHYSALQESLAAGCPSVMPKYALLKVTTRCNSRCAYCSDWRLGQEDASLEALVAVIRDLGESGVKFLNISGGEPLLRDDLPVIITEAKAAGLTTILLTNGVLLPRRARELEDVGIDAIIMSLDTLDAATHEKHRGVKIEPYLAGLEELIAMKGRRPSMFACVTTVVQTDNLAQIPDLVNYVNTRGLGVQFSPHHDLQKEDLVPTLASADSKRVSDLVAQLIGLQREGGLINNSETYLKAIPRFMEHAQMPASYRCMAGYVALYIDAGLGLRPCWFMPAIGNLQEDSVVDLWHSDEAHRVRCEVRSGHCPSCWMLCTAELSLRFSS